jgi:hypothetical protein
MLEPMTSLRPRTHRRLAGLAALALTGSLALAACGGDEEPNAEDPTNTTEGAPAEAPPASPLTGLPVKAGRSQGPVLAVKIDNSSSSSPQVGLRSADMVVEELVEGGMTRLAVFFHSAVPQQVGPVRSMRATDIGIVQPLGAALVASGGAPQTVARVEDAGIEVFTEGAPGFYRDSGRSAPYNLFMELPTLAEEVQPKAVSEPYLPFGDGLPAGKPARGLTASFSGASSSTFELQGGRYVNVDGYAAEGDEFVADTVLVLRVQVGDAGYLDPAGNPVPETRFTGSGKATIFHDGRVVRGTWVKEGLSAPVRLQQGAEELALPPGRVWIELVPAEGGGVTVTR